MITRSQAHFVLVISVVIALATLPATARSGETGRLKIHVNPKQAYVFVDGKAIRDGSQTIDLPPGTHEVSVHNYGYTPKTQAVHIDSHKTTDLNVALMQSGEKVSGPFGDIEFKGHPRAAVLLNGTSPGFFVGHVDEFDWNWIWHQRLLVKPGTYQATVTREGHSVWSGPVRVEAGQRVTVDLNHNGKIKTADWAQGNAMAPQPRFRAGIASAVVPIAPVTAQLAAQTPSLACGQGAELNWKSENAVEASIANLGNVPTRGDRKVSPDKTTTYELVAKGPGGEAKNATTVKVNSQPTATLTLSQPEVHYRKVGNKVTQDDATTLNWSASNANRVTISSLGNEGMSGHQTIETKPRQTSVGPVNEVVDYTLAARNACGGTTTKTVALHIVGSIDPAPAVTLASIFYPTNYPGAQNPKIGLVASEKEALSQAADRFKKHEQYDDDHATLMIVGHADIRGPKIYNLRLSARRAEVVKRYLVAQGIPANNIQTKAEGKREELNEKDVLALQMKDTQKPETWMMRHAHSTWLAYNRRVDIILEPSGQQSTEAFPNDASDAHILWQRPQPSLKKVELAANTATTTASAPGVASRH